MNMRPVLAFLLLVSVLITCVQTKGHHGHHGHHGHGHGHGHGTRVARGQSLGGGGGGGGGDGMELCEILTWISRCFSSCLSDTDAGEAEVVEEEAQGSDHAEFVVVVVEVVEEGAGHNDVTVEEIQHPSRCQNNTVQVKVKLTVDRSFLNI